jgi:hypothetical protein
MSLLQPRNQKFALLLLIHRAERRSIDPFHSIRETNPSPFYAPTSRARSVPVLRLRRRLFRRRGGFRLIHRDVPGKERGAEGESWERVTPGLVQQRVRAPRVRADEWVGGHRIGSDRTAGVVVECVFGRRCSNGRTIVEV